MFIKSRTTTTYEFNTPMAWLVSSGFNHCDVRHHIANVVVVGHVPNVVLLELACDVVFVCALGRRLAFNHLEECSSKLI